MSRELKTGLVAIAIIALFIWGYNFLKGRNLFINVKTAYVEYDNIQGLNKASAVFLNGLKIGKVSDISFNPKEDKKGGLLVELLIDNDIDFGKKSIAKINSSLLGGASVTIVPDFKGQSFQSGDTLVAQVEDDVMTSVKATLEPLKNEIESVILGTDSLLTGLNEILDSKGQQSLKNSIKQMEVTLTNINKTVTSVNSMFANDGDLKATLKNTKNITDNFSKVSDTLVNANLGSVIANLDTSIESLNSMLNKVNDGSGTVGKLMSDDEMYTNLTNATKELEELLREMKLNPKRFVHFSLFGKRAKPYDSETNKNNQSNQ